MRPRIAVVDYGAGNLHSVRRALEHGGAEVTTTTDPELLLRADATVLPGVGSAKTAMEQLSSTGVADALRELVSAGRPLLGICLGMQLLFGENEEGPTHGLGMLPGRVERIRGVRKVPHMGWNDLVKHSECTLLSDVPSGSYVYFVHSYRVQPADPEHVVATTEYGGPIVAVVAQDNVMGTQFHPEKSGEVGLRMYKSFVEAVGRCY